MPADWSKAPASPVAVPCRNGRNVDGERRAETRFWLEDPRVVPFVDLSIEMGQAIRFTQSVRAVPLRH